MNPFDDHVAELMRQLEAPLGEGDVVPETVPPGVQRQVSMLSQFTDLFGQWDQMMEAYRQEMEQEENKEPVVEET